MMEQGQGQDHHRDRGEGGEADTNQVDRLPKRFFEHPARGPSLPCL